MALPRRQTMTVEEYFDLEKNDPDRGYEYEDGQVSMMAGGSPPHSIISHNLGRILGNLLEDSPCIVYSPDIYFQVAEDCYLHPDVTVSCHAQDAVSIKVIQYPCLVAEVLSPSTEARDRGIKFELYRACPTIQEYLLVNPEMFKIELFRREKNHLWTILTYKAGEYLELTSLGVRFLVDDVYKKVRFSPE